MPEQGETYSAHIEQQLYYERERRKTLDARALAVTTTSSAFVGLALALSVLVTGKDYKFTGAGGAVVVASLLAFVTAAVFGLVANMMKPHDVTSSETLLKMVREHWKDDEVDARNIVATLNIRTIDTLRTGSNAKVVWIKRAAAVQLAAVLLLIVAVAAEVSAVSLG